MTYGLRNAYDAEELATYFARCGATQYVAMAKLDGMFAQVEYRNGIPMRLESKKCDLSHLIGRISGLPSFNTGNVTVRGELIAQPQLVAQYGGVAHVASVAAAMGADPFSHEQLRFVAFDCDIGDYLTFGLAHLHSHGFDVAPYQLIEMQTDVASISLPTEYPTDGIVIAVNDRTKANNIGRTKRYRRWIVAYKGDLADSIR